MNDTIFALSSGRGKSGVAVIRISGDDLRRFFANIIIDNRPTPRCYAPTPSAGEGDAGLWVSPQLEIKPRFAYLINLQDTDGALIDQCITIYFPAPNSFTGEDVVEIQGHGSPAVIEKIFAWLRTQKSGGQNFRMAEPGEFTRRAFQNNKMDLVAADGLVSLLDARTDKQRTAALKSMTGDSQVYENWRAQMLKIAAFSAAILDYPSDELPENIGEKLFAQTQKLCDEIKNAISRYAASRSIRSGFNIVLVGETNAGKSSLFNRLVGESRAIVSEIPGTTRDVVSSELDIDGYLVRLSDTAGLRDTSDTIEKIGIARTHAEIESADLILRVKSEQVKSEECKENELIIYNKCDLLKHTSTHHSSLITHNCFVSALTGEGIPKLLEIIKQKIHEQLDGAESDVSVNARARGHLIAAADELENALKHGKNFDLFAESVRFAANEIGQILGTISTSEIADAVFGQLCLGK
jgi:tRNA modification GTPase